MINSESFITVIPARYQSSRFPGKPLALINGESMVSIVYRNAVSAKNTGDVVVATDDERIYKHCEEKDIKVIYTSKDCENGSMRAAEVAEKYSVQHVFELQGDQPLVGPDIIDSFLENAVLQMAENENIDIVQPYSKMEDSILADPDVLKVAISLTGKFLVYTRLPMKTGYRTLGLYLWKRDSLLSFREMKETPLERAETTHLNRFLENDLFVQGVELDDKDWIEVDRKEHIKLVEDVLNTRDKV